MRSRCFVLLASLLLLLLTLPLAAQDFEGETYASIAPTGLSSLGVNVASLEQEVCNLADTGPDRGSVLIIVNDGGGVHPASLQATVVTATSSPPRTAIQAWVRPTHLHAVGAETLQLACGTFTYRLALDAATAQPISPLALAPASAGANHGVVVGNLSMHAVLIVEPVGFGSPFQQPRSMNLKINGHYTLLMIEDTRPGDSRLQLFTTELNGSVVSSPSWLEDSNDPNTRLLLESPSWRLPPRQ
jgi:hypothetical protein